MEITTAVYLPQHDIWAEMPLADTHMCMKLDERLESGCINGIHKAGYWFDYVNDDVLKRWEEYRYDTLLLIECDRIPQATMEHIRAFARNGGRVLAAQRPPQKACGLKNYEEHTNRVQEIVREMEAAGELLVTADKYESLLQALRSVKEPDVKLCRHPDVIGYVHRRTESEDIYFVANVSPKDRKEEIFFSGRSENFCVFDPMTGEEKAVEAFRKEKDGLRAFVCMEGFQSLLFVFSKEMEEPLTAEEVQRELFLELSQNWTLTVEEKEFHKEYKILESWEKEPALRYYSGVGSYRKAFSVTKEQWERLQAAPDAVLTLEHAGETAEVILNGKKVAALIKRPYRINVAGYLKEGENILEIRVTNLLINRMLDPAYSEPELPRNMQEWPYATGGLMQCRRERLYNWREREMIKEPLASGLWGSVRIFL